MAVPAAWASGRPGDRGGDGSAGAWRTGLIANDALNPKIAVLYTGLLPPVARGACLRWSGWRSWCWSTWC
ncbi:hypothetical protein AB0D46_02330 [Streptomyces sp. NPDC048383]|uniref:hypothetical protein n=1 Tax=Streptomyces sp. NPDC048383 TaxID=3155386 RepID=UPI00342F0232